jgi:hypothetical protein
MKPTPLTARKTSRDSFERTISKPRRWPITDNNYHSVATDASSANCVRGSVRSFWNIAGDYVKNEARHDFLGEAALFSWSLSSRHFFP